MAVSSDVYLNEAPVLTLRNCLHMRFLITVRPQVTTHGLFERLAVSLQLGLQRHCTHTHCTHTIPAHWWLCHCQLATKSKPGHCTALHPGRRLWQRPRNALRDELSACGICRCLEAASDARVMGHMDPLAGLGGEEHSMAERAPTNLQIQCTSRAVAVTASTPTASSR